MTQIVGVGRTWIIRSYDTCPRPEMSCNKECIAVKTQLNPRILFLAIATFAVGTDAYVIAGTLPSKGEHKGRATGVVKGFIRDNV